jgi:alginate O-acetyltransferase complex protein AlgI
LLFSSPIFIFFFLPISLAAYFMAPPRFKNVTLLALSLIFYGWSGGSDVIVLIGSLCLNYVLALFIARQVGSAGNPRAGRRLLFVGVACNVALLVAFKYLSFFMQQFALVGSLLGQGWAVPRIALPIGISFFTFKGLSYLIDVYRGNVEAERNVVGYATYQALFPQVLAGPIVRYRQIASTIARRTVTSGGFRDGIHRFVIGLAKKTLIADQLGPAVDLAFSIPTAHLSCPDAWIGIICYTLQIYFDFSGYSDMAIGLARMFGFDTPENFDYPYISRSVREFWRRWHITLSEWFRDYLYIPLGGNRRGGSRTYFNLLVVFFLCGLWHGASWTFPVWGLWHGVFLVFERTRAGRALTRLAPLNHVYTCLVFVIGWVFFRSSDLTQATGYLAALFGAGHNAVTLPAHALLNAKTGVVGAVGVFGSLPVAKQIVAHFLTAQKPAVLFGAERLAVLVVLLVVFVLSLSSVALQVYRPFIYFQF